MQRRRLALSMRRGKALSGDLSCPDYHHFYTHPCSGVIENVFSWQECGKALITRDFIGSIYHLEDFAYEHEEHVDVLGLRCYTAVHCHFWRWTHPQADLFEPKMNCQVQKGQRCKHGRCEIFTREGRPWCQKLATGSLEKGSSPNGSSYFSYVSGEKKCYKQVLGATNGCFRQDFSYREDEVKLMHENKVFWKYGLQSANHVEGVYHNWGACALKCKANPSCGYWTWASSSCSDCFPETCFLYDKLNDVEDLKLYEQRGHISGEVECQDITYIERKDNRKVQNSLDLGTPWKTGGCQSSGGTKPFCPAQAVPGYK